MKIRKGYVLNDIAGEQIVVAVGEEALRFQGVVKLNATGAFLWKLLEDSCTKEELTAALTKKYGIAPEQAVQDTEAFLDILQNAGIIEA